MPAPTPPLRPIESLSRKDGVVNAVRRAVVVGTLKPGDRLTEVGLATMLGVSRHTVREAINLLVTDGMLEQEPYKGLHVTELGGQDIVALARSRQALDLVAVREILEDPTGYRMDVFLQGWTSYSRLVFDDDPLVAHESHIAFHRQLWVASENTMLLRIWPVVRAQVTMALVQDRTMHADPQHVHGVHLRLVEAIRSRDLPTIEAELYRHTIEAAEDTARAWAQLQD